MSKAPLVSVILPSYNHAGFIMAAVESVLSQSYGNLELLVIDDGSSDGTPDQLAEIKDVRLKLVRIEKNRLYQIRNLGLSMAKGRYIAFQNSDDEWHPEKIKAQMTILRKRRDLAVCFTDVEIIDENNQVMANSWANGLFTTENCSNIAWLRRFFEQGNCLCITSAVVRRDKLDQAGVFRGSLIQVSDFDLWVRLAVTGQFHTVNEKLTRMRIVGGQKSQVSESGVQPQSDHSIHWSNVPGLRLFRRASGLILPAAAKPKIKAMFGIRNVPEPPENAPPPEPLIVSSQNLSAPQANTINRAMFEFAEVLENFSKHPVLALLPMIFEDTMPAFLNSSCVQQAWLAKYAWSKGSVAHHLFANRLMASLLEKDDVRKEITTVFGAEIVHEFVKRRGQLSLGLNIGE